MRRLLGHGAGAGERLRREDLAQQARQLPPLRIGAAAPDRERERLATSDRGIIMLREMMQREIAKVQKGLEPIGVVRDPGHVMIDTNLKRSLELARRRLRPKPLPAAR